VAGDGGGRLTAAYWLECRLHRVLWCLLAAFLAFSTCGDGEASQPATSEPTPEPVPAVAIVEPPPLEVFPASAEPTPEPVFIGAAPEPAVIGAAEPLPPPPQGDIGAWLTAAGWPLELQGEASAVAWCESRHSPEARNGAYLGLFQLWDGWFRYAGLDAAQWADPVVNATAALAAYRYSDGWAQWTCQP